MSLERMCSAAIQPPSFHAQKLHFSPKHTVALQPNIAKSFRISAAAAAVLNPDPLSTTPPREQKLGVVVKPAEKRRLVLKFIWMEKNIGISIDQVIPGYGTIPLSPYYFWPRKDAWEELKSLLESKSWISHKQIVILLNQATDIINLWQQSGGDFA